MLPIHFTSRLLKRIKDAATLLDVLMFVNDYGEIYELNAEQLKEATNKAKEVYYRRVWFDYCKRYENDELIAVSDIKKTYTTNDKKKGFFSFSMLVEMDDLTPQLFKDFEGYNVRVSLSNNLKGFAVTISHDFER